MPTMSCSLKNTQKKELIKGVVNTSKKNIQHNFNAQNAKRNGKHTFGPIQKSQESQCHVSCSSRYEVRNSCRVLSEQLCQQNYSDTGCSI